MGCACQRGGGMAALYACTKCHQRFPFEALSQGQQLCKVRGTAGSGGSSWGCGEGQRRGAEGHGGKGRGPVREGVVGRGGGGGEVKGSPEVRWGAGGLR